MSDKRLYNLNQKQIEQWRLARQEVGRKRYGDKHLQRYGAVDIMEELLDAENILNLLFDRVKLRIVNPADMELVLLNIIELGTNLTKLQDKLIRLDRVLNDDVCTDEQGGDRIWWGDHSECN